jgi:hypothetical protein
MAQFLLYSRILRKIAKIPKAANRQAQRNLSNATKRRNCAVALRWQYFKRMHHDYTIETTLVRQLGRRPV